MIDAPMHVPEANRARLRVWVAVVQGAVLSVALIALAVALALRSLRERNERRDALLTIVQNQYDSCTILRARLLKYEATRAVLEIDFDDPANRQNRGRSQFVFERDRDGRWVNNEGYTDRWTQ